MGQFADGLFSMSQKGIRGKRFNMTKKRAWILRDMIKILMDYIPEESDPRFHDWNATLEFLKDQVNKRYSEFDLGNT